MLSHHSWFNVTCECNKEEIDDNDDDCFNVSGNTKVSVTPEWPLTHYTTTHLLIGSGILGSYQEASSPNKLPYMFLATLRL